MCSALCFPLSFPQHNHDGVRIRLQPSEPKGGGSERVRNSLQKAKGRECTPRPWTQPCPFPLGPRRLVAGAVCPGASKTGCAASREFKTKDDNDGGSVAFSYLSPSPPISRSEQVSGETLPPPERTAPVPSALHPVLQPQQAPAVFMAVLSGKAQVPFLAGPNQVRICKRTF